MTAVPGDRCPAPLIASLCLLGLAALPSLNVLAGDAAGQQAADPDWHIPIPAEDLAREAMPPPHPGYQWLKDAQESYLAIRRAGGWQPVSAGSDLRLGDRDPRVATLRNRLRVTGDYDSEMGADAWFFDTGVDKAVRRFQQRHGLHVTGIFDERTRDAANVSIEDRLAQLTVTLERWRWLPRDLGRQYVWANVGGATLEVFDAGRPVLYMRTIVGHPERPTPSFRSEIRQVVFNPTWTVPRIIAVEDLLPRQQEDINYLPQHQIRVFSAPSSGARALDARAIAWDRLAADRFPYRLVQDAGPANSLGRFKIVMDNPYDIYLHDTPSKPLFDLMTRTLGSGCIRLEQASTFVNFLLANDRDWSEAKTAARLANPATQTVNLQRRIPIYVVYMTSWVTPEGEINFRRDVYGRDEKVLRSLTSAQDSGMRQSGS